MSDLERTQKQVGEKYQGNLRYFKKQQFLARMRFFLSALAVLAAVEAIVWVEQSPVENAYNPAPLSLSHAYLEANCQQCHQNARPGSALHHPFLQGGGFAGSAAAINMACQKCHEDQDLHQPTEETLALEDYHRQLTVVTATGCFACHQEHLGRVSLRLPGDAACAACHNSPEAMARHTQRKPLPGKFASEIAIDGTTSDGVVHFIPPQTAVPIFASFAQGHPPFGYEKPGLLDPDVLSFNHQRHAAADIPPVDGQKLDCAYCHKPAADGVYYGRVTYEQGCQACHALQFDPKNPQLTLPHGNIEGVRAFLRSLPYQYGRIAAQKNPAVDQKAFVLQQMLALKQRVRNGENFEHEIFFTRNPYRDQPGETPRAFFPGCAYCHEVSAAKNGDPLVTRPAMADRWLSHGAFTHARHVPVSCVACHDADHSQKTSDIIMPSKQSCTNCHAPEGSAPFNCLACHTFHAPVDTVRKIEGHGGLPPAAAPVDSGFLHGMLSSAPR